MRRIITAALVGLAIATSQTATAGPRTPGVAGAASVAEATRASGEARVIATLEARQGGALQTARRQLEARMGAAGVRKLTHLGRLPFVALKVSPAQLQALLGTGLVGRVSEDRVAFPSLAESVPLIGGVAARNAGATGRGWAVAVLDTGVDTSHPFLAGKTVAEACFTDEACPNGTDRQIGFGAGRPCPFFRCDHGTHVAGIAVGKGSGFSGVAREGRLIPVQVFDDCGGSTCAYFSNLIRALDHVLTLASRHRIASVNMSLSTLGFGVSNFCDSEEIKTPIDLLRARGIATVIAAGNDGFAGQIGVPSCVSSAIAVGATYDDPQNEGVTGYSNFAPMLDMLAPGSFIDSSVPGGFFDTFSGTSMAAPHVAGAWAALKSKVPTAGVRRIETALEGTGKRLVDPETGLARPRINVNLALRALLAGSAVVAQSAP